MSYYRPKNPPQSHLHDHSSIENHQGSNVNTSNMQQSRYTSRKPAKKHTASWSPKAKDEPQQETSAFTPKWTPKPQGHHDDHNQGHRRDDFHDRSSYAGGEPGAAGGGEDDDDAVVKQKLYATYLQAQETAAREAELAMKEYEMRLKMGNPLAPLPSSTTSRNVVHQDASPPRHSHRQRPRDPRDTFERYREYYSEDSGLAPARSSYQTPPSLEGTSFPSLPAQPVPKAAPQVRPSPAPSISPFEAKKQQQPAPSPPKTSPNTSSKQKPRVYKPKSPQPASAPPPAARADEATKPSPPASVPVPATVQQHQQKAPEQKPKPKRMTEEEIAAAAAEKARLEELEAIKRHQERTLAAKKRAEEERLKQEAERAEKLAKEEARRAAEEEAARKKQQERYLRKEQARIAREAAEAERAAEQMRARQAEERKKRAAEEAAKQQAFSAPKLGNAFASLDVHTAEEPDEATEHTPAADNTVRAPTAQQLEKLRKKEEQRKIREEQRKQHAEAEKLRKEQEKQRRAAEAEARRKALEAAPKPPLLSLPEVALKRIFSFLPDIGLVCLPRRASKVLCKFIDTSVLGTMESVTIHHKIQTKPTNALSSKMKVLKEVTFGQYVPNNTVSSFVSANPNSKTLRVLGPVTLQTLVPYNVTKVVLSSSPSDLQRFRLATEVKFQGVVFSSPRLEIPASITQVEFEKCTWAFGSEWLLLSLANPKAVTRFRALDCFPRYNRGPEKGICVKNGKEMKLQSLGLRQAVVSCAFGDDHLDFLASANPENLLELKLHALQDISQGAISTLLAKLPTGASVDIDSTVAGSVAPKAYSSIHSLTWHGSGDENELKRLPPPFVFPNLQTIKLVNAAIPPDPTQQGLRFKNLTSFTLEDCEMASNQLQKFIENHAQLQELCYIEHHEDDEEEDEESGDYDSDGERKSRRKKKWTLLLEHPRLRRVEITKRDAKVTLGDCPSLQSVKIADAELEFALEATLQLPSLTHLELVIDDDNIEAGESGSTNDVMKDLRVDLGQVCPNLRTIRLPKSRILPSDAISMLSRHFPDAYLCLIDSCRPGSDAEIMALLRDQIAQQAAAQSAKTLPPVPTSGGKKSKPKRTPTRQFGTMVHCPSFQGACMVLTDVPLPGLGGEEVGVRPRLQPLTVTRTDGSTAQYLPKIVFVEVAYLVSMRMQNLPRSHGRGFGDYYGELFQQLLFARLFGGGGFGFYGGSDYDDYDDDYGGGGGYYGGSASSYGRGGGSGVGALVPSGHRF